MNRDHQQKNKRSALLIKLGRRNGQFIDMCMLCGCDYLEPLKGIGAKTALKLVREHDDMESILDHLRKGKNPPPEEWPYEEARELFKNPDVKKSSEIEVSLSACPARGLKVEAGWRKGTDPDPMGEVRITAQVGSA